MERPRNKENSLCSPNTAAFQQRRKFVRRKAGRMGIMLALTSLLLTLFGCASGTTYTPTSPTIPSGTVLYQTDWSHGLAGWTVPTGLSAQWSKGQLHVTCQALGTLSLHYQPDVPDYALEVPVQIEQTVSNAGLFSFSAQQNSDKDGYTVGIASLETKRPFHGQVEAFINPNNHSSTFYTADYSPDTRWVTYRIEIQDNAVTLFVNGARHGQALSNQTSNLSPGPLGLDCGHITLNIGPLTITAL